MRPRAPTFDRAKFNHKLSAVAPHFPTVRGCAFIGPLQVSIYENTGIQENITQYSLLENIRIVDDLGVQMMDRVRVLSRTNWKRTNDLLEILVIGIRNRA